MATVNLGRIKPVFRGAFSNSTAYVIDDIVTSGNETFIAIAATQGNATTDASKWTKLAAKGADGSDGTDVAATLANKEISFKTNAGALDGIPIGTAGQFLKVNSGATGYEYGAVSTPIEKVSYLVHNTRVATSSSADIQLYSSTFTKAKAGTKIYVQANLPTWNNTINGGNYMYLQLTDGSTTQRTFEGISRPFLSTSESGNTNMVCRFSSSFNAGTITLSSGWDTANNGGNRPFAVLNPNSSDDARNHQNASVYHIFEVNE